MKATPDILAQKVKHMFHQGKKAYGTRRIKKVLAKDGVESKRVFIKVLAEYNEYSKMTPKQITWPDRREFEMRLTACCRLSLALPNPVVRVSAICAVFRIK